MAEALFEVLLDNLSSLIKGEIGLMMGVDKEMKKLSSTLTTIQAVLEDAEDKQLESKPIRNWLCKLKDLAYEIEDILDECATKVSKLRHKSGKLNRFKKFLNRREIGRRMKEVTDKLDAVAAERKFHLNERDCSKLVERQSKADSTRETCSILNEPDLVYGRDEDKEKIVDILMNDVRDSQQLSVLPIIGIGGVGKTTLAQLVYNDPRVTKHFEKKLWVCVSDNFDTKTLVKAMIESATGSASASDLVHLEALQSRLRELLNQKRYLLILDDVWNDDEDNWDKLKGILACGSRGASIVVTTRIRKVAGIMEKIVAPYELKVLSEEHCWLLFRQRAFRQEMGKHPPNLEAIGKQIVKKCGGVPLAAKALGSLLRFKMEEKEWVHVKESEIWNLETPILPALRLSYQHLPLQLRQCFAYCAVYPKDHVFEKEELIYCWMAHGYISSNGRMDVEDVGNEIWNGLVLRSLFQDVNNYKSKTTFKMHDLVHDLAQSIMENKVPGAEIESSDHQSALNRNKIRQVNVRERHVAFPKSFEKKVDISYTLKNFNCLRMLDASKTQMKILPSEIDKLKRLRYLNLYSTVLLRTLPDTVCSLWNLKILNLSFCSQLVELPKSMRYMKNIRHLLLEGCASLSEMPPKIGELTSLKTLSLFVVGHKIDNQVGELQCLNLGGRLEIRHVDRVKNHLDAKKANIGLKRNLRDLVLRWRGENVSIQQQEMDEQVLEALEPPRHLESLSIHGFKGRCFPSWKRIENIIRIHIEDGPNCLRLPPLGDLRHLKSLRLVKLVALEYVMETEVLQVGDQVKAILFPSLVELKLQYLPNLKGLLKEEEEVGDIFPQLQQLYIWECPMLILPALSSLKELKAWRCKNLINSFNKCVNLTYLFVQFDNDMRTCNPKKTLKNLSNLKKLVLRNADEHNLPIEGLQGLKSLKELEIQDCNTLRCIPDGWLRHLTALEKILIYNCNELVELPEGIKFLHSLKHLKLIGLPKMVRLPEVLQYLPSLQHLILGHLEQLTSLPDWLDNFITSSQVSEDEYFTRLRSLPATSIQGMTTNLRELTIGGCGMHPELRRRYLKGNGEGQAHVL